MDKITLQNMTFFGFHGCQKFEQQTGQFFEIDLEISTNLAQAGNTDSLDDAINYAEAFNKTKAVVETERHNLLEAVAESIAAKILEDGRIREVTVRIRKPGVPLPGNLRCVQIEISRQNSA